MDSLKPYAVFDSIYMLQWCDLYSGNENDPIVDATIYAKDHLAFDSNGNSLPFSLQVSFPAQNINRGNCLFEDIPIIRRRLEQKVVITVIIFNNNEDFFNYNNSSVIFR